MRAVKKKLNIFTLLHIRIGNLNWRKCGNCKNEAREIDSLLWGDRGECNAY